MLFAAKPAALNTIWKLFSWGDQGKEEIQNSLSKLGLPSIDIL